MTPQLLNLIGSLALIAISIGAIAVSIRDGRL